MRRPLTSSRATILAALFVTACGSPDSSTDSGDAGPMSDAHDAAHPLDVLAMDAPADDTVSDAPADDTVSDDALDTSVDDTVNDAPPDDTMSGGGDAGDAGDPLLTRRQNCDFHSGAMVADTLGFTAAQRAALPIRHLIILVNENRSFDHYLGKLSHFTGRTDIESIPAGYTNPTGSGTTTAAPAHATTTCISPDTPHGWTPMHQEYAAGAMNGFYTTAAANSGGDPHRVLAYYDQRDLPFYYWLYSTFSISDRFFSSVMGPTWPNRDFLYAATADGVHNTGERAINVPTIFQSMSTAHVTWRVYADNLNSRQDCIGWTSSHPGIVPYGPNLLNDVRNNTLPQVAFIDPVGSQDEHPSGDVVHGEAWVRTLVTTLMASPSWASTALIITYDEAGGFFDHVRPPSACAPSTNTADAEFNRLGFRVPLVVVSPWARPAYVSHVVHETASIPRLIETVFDLPALTRRDANAGALLDLFDFSSPHLMHVAGTPPDSGTSHCP